MLLCVPTAAEVQRPRGGLPSQIGPRTRVWAAGMMEPQPIWALRELRWLTARRSGQHAHSPPVFCITVIQARSLTWLCTACVQPWLMQQRAHVCCQEAGHNVCQGLRVQSSLMFSAPVPASSPSLPLVRVYSPWAWLCTTRAHPMMIDKGRVRALLHEISEQ